MSAECFWAVFGIAYAAFWIWQTARIVNRQKRWRSLAIAAMIFLLMPLLYFLLIGPVAFLERSGTIRQGVYEFALHPVRIVADGTDLKPIWFWSICDDYLRWWFRLAVPTDP
jgi:hypothetical protein